MLTDEEQTFIRAIGIRGMSTHRTRLARIMGIDFYRQRRVQESLIGNHALQLSKRPFGIGGIGFTLLPTGFLALFVFSTFANVCQALQANEAMGVLIFDAFRDHMIGVLLQPSLPSTDDDESPRCGTGAFFLKTLSQSRIIVRLGNDSLPRVEGTLSPGS